MKILVTGANGYLGQGIVKSILKMNHKIIATDYEVNNVDERAVKIESDIFNLNEPYVFFDQPDMLLHLAWRDGFIHYSDAHINDLPKHYKFIRQMAEAGVKQITVMGSMHEIGFFEGSIDENTPEQAIKRITQQREEAGITEPQNLEEQAISLVGMDIYEKLVKGYTEKQWGRSCKDLPAFIIKRLPVRFTYDNNYFNALYQGIPIGGYTQMISNMLKDVEVRLNLDYLEHKDELDALAKKVVYTGPIDAYFNYCLGYLEYRSVRFKTETLDMPNYQGNPVVNYTDRETPYTRVIEHKWFEFGKDKKGNDIPKTVVTWEYSTEWKPGDEPYYPVNDKKNQKKYAGYKAMAKLEPGILFGGRLGEYKYYDMDQVVRASLDAASGEYA